MGHSNWSNDFYRDQEADRVKSGVDAFAYHATVAAKPIAEQKVHPQMDPKGVMRESRDSDAHPESRAIALMLDETGSMRETPIVMREHLPTLMSQIEKKGGKDPQILFGAIGDATNHEKASLQTGQFESGVEMAADLGKIFMEGKGGGSNHESYQNAIYFFARHTSIDCFEKRGVKGLLFIVGDELPYDQVSALEVSVLIGDNLQDNIPIKDIVKECQEKWDIYYVLPRGSDNFNDSRIKSYWEELLGAGKLIILNDPASICETIASIAAGATTADIKSTAKSVRL